MATEYRHQPVMLDETLELLRPHPGATVVDGTLGGGGHSAAILARIGSVGRLIALDRDADAIRAARMRIDDSQLLGPHVFLVQASFGDLGEVLSSLGVTEVDGVLLDLGVSSWQLDSPERGFRFASSDGSSPALDMRMDTSKGPTAAELLRHASPQELERWFREYGEIPRAAALARAVVRARSRAPIERADDLVQIAREARIGGDRSHHPATLVFQALRIAVNDELGELARGLAAAIEALRPGGRLVVLSYHSLEDRIVKQTFRGEARGCVCPPRIPVCVCGRTPRLTILTNKPLRPQESELRANPRARSARLRAAERIAEAA